MFEAGQQLSGCCVQVCSLICFLSITQDDFSMNEEAIKYPFTSSKFYWIQKNKRKSMNVNTLKMYVEKKLLRFCYYTREELTCSDQIQLIKNRVLHKLKQN